MGVFSSVLFQMSAGNANAFSCPIWQSNFNPTFLGNRLIVLRNLIALGKVGIKIVFACEDRLGIDAAVQRQGSLQSKFNCLPIQNRESAGEPETNGTNIGVGRSPKTGRTAAENLSPRGELNVDLQTDDRLILGPRRDRLQFFVRFGDHCRRGLFSDRDGDAH